MTIMACSQSCKGDVSLDDLPIWKKELILRKRANSRVHGDLSITSVAYLDTTAVASSANNSLHIADRSNEQRSCRGHQLSSCSGWGPVNSAHSASVEKNQSQSVYSKSSEGVESASSDSESDLSAACLIGNKNDVDNRTLSKDREATDMHHKGLNNRHCSRTGSKVISKDCDQEEFQYGPGIVSRLKDRYLSLAMRETKNRSSLRKFSSLEDLLDDEPIHERGRSSIKTKTITGTQPSRKELMKRTRSVDSLSFRKVYEPSMPKSVSSGGIKDASAEVKKTQPLYDTTTKQINIEDINKKDLCRQSSTSSSILDEDELPQHDTVRQTKQIFESGNSAVRVARGTAAKVAAYKAAKPASNKPAKPAIKAKPPQLMARKAPLTPALENVRVKLKQVPVGKPVPRSTLGLRAAVGENASPSLKNNFSSGLTPVTASVTAPLVNGDYKPKEKSGSLQNGSSNARLNLRKEDFDITDRAISSFNSKGRPLSPVPATLPPSPPLSHKINNMIDGDSENMKEMERVMLENKKNMEKHLVAVAKKSNDIQLSPVKKSCPKTTHVMNNGKSTVPIVDPTMDDYFITNEELANGDETVFKSDLGAVPSMKPKTNLKEAQNNSVMFDFTKRNDTPSYIENDGLDMSKRKKLQYNENSGYVIMPGYEGRQDSSTDGDDLEDDPLEPRTDVEPPPCNIRFDGEGVIINGRSNLQRQPKSKKLDISFDMSSTNVYEYPSESSVLIDYEDTLDDVTSPVMQVSQIGQNTSITKGCEGDFKCDFKKRSEESHTKDDLSVRSCYNIIKEPVDIGSSVAILPGALKIYSPTVENNTSLANSPVVQYLPNRCHNRYQLFKPGLQPNYGNSRVKCIIDNFERMCLLSRKSEISVLPAKVPELFRNMNLTTSTDMSSFVPINITGKRKENLSCVAKDVKESRILMESDQNTDSVKNAQISKDDGYDLAVPKPCHKLFLQSKLATLPVLNPLNVSRVSKTHLSSGHVHAIDKDRSVTISGINKLSGSNVYNTFMASTMDTSKPGLALGTTSFSGNMSSKLNILPGYSSFLNKSLGSSICGNSPSHPCLLDAHPPKIIQFHLKSNVQNPIVPPRSHSSNRYSTNSVYKRSLTYRKLVDIIK